MKRNNRAREEYESRFRGMALLFSMLGTEHGIFECPVGKRDGERFLFWLGERLSKATKAQKAVLYLRSDGHVYVGKHPAGLSWRKPRSENELIHRTRLMVPVRAQGKFSGYIDIQAPRGGHFFTTQDKKLVKATASLLGFVVQRDKAELSRGSLVRHIIEDHRSEALVYRVRELTEGCTTRLTNMCQSVLVEISRRICFSAGLMGLDDESNSFERIASVGDPVVLANLEDIVRQKGRSLDTGLFFHRYGNGSAKKHQTECLNAVMIVPLSRLTSHRGVLALLRCGEQADFSTVEKRALQTVAALVTDYTRNPATLRSER